MAHRRHMLTDGQGEALNESSVHPVAKWSQNDLDGLQGATHHAVPHADLTAPPHRLDHLRVEQLWQRHPARLGQGTYGLTPWRLHPVPIVGQQGRQILPKTIREKQRNTIRSQDLHHVVDHALGHRQRTVPDVEPKQQFTLGVHRHPEPLGRPLQALDRFGLADLAVLDRTEESKQLIQLHLPDPHVMQDVL